MPLTQVWASLQAGSDQGQLTVEQDSKEHRDSLLAERATQGAIWPA